MIKKILLPLPMRRARSGSIAMEVSTKLELHGVGASSSPHSLVYLPSLSPTRDNDVLVYPSDSIINLARQELSIASLRDAANGSLLYNVHETLRTSTADMSTKTSSSRSITAMKLLQKINPLSASVNASVDKDIETTVHNNGDDDQGILVCAFSDGTITLWINSFSDEAINDIDEKMKDTCKNQDELGSTRWKEYIVRNGSNMTTETESDPEVESITDIDGVILYSRNAGGDYISRVFIVTVSSYGIFSHTYELYPAASLLSSTCLSTTPSCSVSVNKLPIKVDMFHDQDGVETMPKAYHVILACGTASSKSNKIQIYTKSFGLNAVHQDDENTSMSQNEASSFGMDLSYWNYHGFLTGHLGWITCLSWLEVPAEHHYSSCLILASGSQDTRIRLWNFQNAMLSEGKSYHNSDNIDREDSSSTENVVEDEDSDDDDNYLEEGEARIHVRIPLSHGIVIDIGVALEAVLMGHEDNITSVSWRPSSTQAPTLLSSSMDRSILIWMEELNDTNQISVNHNDDVAVTNLGDASGSNIWVPVTRVGTAGGILGGSIGSSLLGFVDAIWSKDGKQIIGHGYGGSIHFWSSDTPIGSNELSHNSVERWHGHPGITGHFRGVSDISWETTNGFYLLSAGLDQTCRLWSTIPASFSDRQSTDSCKSSIWREIGRPQVHGYDLNSVACIGTGKINGKGEILHRFASGADEKEVRVFDAPQSILNLLENIHSKMSSLSDDDRVERAYIPSLGLSNRATAQDAMEEGADSGASPWVNMKKKEFDSRNGSAQNNSSDILKSLPYERDLGVTSVWPETRKLFGHQTELICLESTARWHSAGATEDTRVILASSCKARDAENATIRLWDVESNKCIDMLKDGHNSTVVSLSFSPDLKFLAASGKDRRLSIWYQNGTSYHLASIVESAHKRIVWSIDFCPLDPTLLASGSRDGFIKLWRIDDKSADDSINAVEVGEIHRWQPGQKIGGKAEPVTAVAFAPRRFTCDLNHSNTRKTANMCMIAVGFESGLIALYEVHSVVSPCDALKNDVSVRLLHNVPQNACHIGTVKKLVWKPERNEEVESAPLTLASCSMDHGVRIYNVIITKRC